MNTKKTGSFLKSFFPFLGFVGIQFVVIFVGTLALSVLDLLKTPFAGVTDVPAMVDRILEQVNELTIPLVLIADLLAAVWFGILYFRNREEKRYLTERGKPALKRLFGVKSLLLILCLAAGIQLGTGMALSLLEGVRPDWFSALNEATEATGMGTTFLSLAAVALAAPLAEEFAFRGLTLLYAGRIMPFAAANFLQAALFGLFHGNLIQGIYAFVFGLIFGYVAVRYQSIFAAVLLHSLVNLAGCAVTALSGEMTPAEPVKAVIMVASALAIIGSLSGIQRITTQRTAGEPKETESAS